MGLNKSKYKVKPFTKYLLGYVTYPLILGIGLFVIFPQNTLALETYQEDSILFQDDFDDGNYNGWTVESGSWGIDSLKRLYGFQFGTLRTGRLGYGGLWDNYQIEVDTQNDGSFDQGVIFRKTDDNNYYEVGLRFDDGVHRYDTPEVKLTKIESGNSTSLFSTHTFALNRYTNYHLKIQVVQTHIQMWIDQTLIFDLDDPNTTISKGPIALSYWTGNYGLANVRFDNVKVTSLSLITPILPVIFIPGIGGSQLRTNSNVNWSYDNGHGGTYTHQYTVGEDIWVNTNQAITLGNDDYFDVLKLKPDAKTSIADVVPTGNLVSQGYGDIDSFFTDMGYRQGTDFFVFAYDWRKDISGNKAALDNLVEYAKTKSGQPKVNIVAHSMGGLIAQDYIADSAKATKVNKLIKLGVPHLGSVKTLKALLYGDSINQDFYFLHIPIIAGTEIKDLLTNSAAAFELIPSASYYNFYNNTDQLHPFPFNDLSDTDKNGIIGPLNFNETKSLLSNMQANMTAFGLGETYHDTNDPLLNKSNGVQLYNIVGTSQPTIGQIKETTYSLWPLSSIPKTEEIYINGDDTVPLYSASLTNGSLDYSAGATTYYVSQKHNDLVTSSGTAMQTVKAILQNDSLPVAVKSERIALEGKQISTDLDIDLYDNNNHHTGLNTDGEIENNIPNTYYDSINNTKNLFIKKGTGSLKLKLKSSKKRKADLKIRTYADDLVTQTVYYRDIPVSEGSVIELSYNPDSLTPPSIPVDGQLVSPTTTVTGTNVLDFILPTTTVSISGNKDGSRNYTGPVTITLNGADIGSGILKTEYSLDNGVTVNTYTEPFTITGPGEFTLQVKSVDKVGNEEVVQTIKFTILGSGQSSEESGATAFSNSDTTQTNQITTPTALVNNFTNNLNITPEDEKVLGQSTKQKKAENKYGEKINLWEFLALPVMLVTLLTAGLVFSLLKPPPE